MLLKIKTDEPMVYNRAKIKMKKFLIVLGVVAAFLTATAFVTAEKANTLPGPGDGVTSCDVYGADGYRATVVEKVITPEVNTGKLRARVKLNKRAERNIKVVVQLRNSNNCVIETQPLIIYKDRIEDQTFFKKTGSSGEVYYVTINSASCN